MGGIFLPRIISSLRRGLILFWTRTDQSPLEVAFTARVSVYPRHVTSARMRRLVAFSDVLLEEL